MADLFWFMLLGGLKEALDMVKQGDLSSEAIALAAAIGALSKALDSTGSAGRETGRLMREAGALSDAGGSLHLTTSALADIIEMVAGKRGQVVRANG